jgi:hypothetical protein
MLDRRQAFFLAGMAARLSVYLAGGVLGLGVAYVIGLSVGHALHVGAACWDAKAFLVALTCAMLADELAKRLILGKDGT